MQASKSTAPAWGLAAASACCAWAALPPLDLWPLSFVSVFLLVLAARRAGSRRTAILSTFTSYFLAWLWINHWIIDVTLAGWPVLSAYVALYPAMAAWLLRGIGSDRNLGRWPSAVTVPLVFIGLECARGLIIFDGYPWYFIGQPLIEAPILAQPADIIGAWWGSLFVGAVAGLCVDVVRPVHRRSTGSSIVVGVLLVLAVPYGAWRLAQDDVFSSGPSILAIQTNLPQDNKIGWSVQAQFEDVPSFIELTLDAVEATGGADLVAWPETMVPGLGFDRGTRTSLEAADPGFAHLHHWPGRIEQLASVLGRPLLVGSPTWLDLSQSVDERGTWMEGRTRYNSAVLVEPGGGLQRYDKVVLTPFGERMPYLEHWPWLEKQLLVFGAGGMEFNLEASDRVQVLSLEYPGGTCGIGTPICFEDTVPGLCRDLVYFEGEKRAMLLMNLSNDGWFGGDDAARRTHVQVARWRCIENRVPMIRVVNTGETSCTDSLGRVQATTQPRVPSWLLCEPQVDSRRTMFGTTFGNLVAWLCFTTLCGLVAWRCTLGRSSRDEGVSDAVV